MGDFDFLCGRTSHFVVFPPFGILLKKFASGFEKTSLKTDMEPLEEEINQQKWANS